MARDVSGRLGTSRVWGDHRDSPDALWFQDNLAMALSRVGKHEEVAMVAMVALWFRHSFRMFQNEFTDLFLVINSWPFGYLT